MASLRTLSSFDNSWVDSNKNDHKKTRLVILVMSIAVIFELVLDEVADACKFNEKLSFPQILFKDYTPSQETKKRMFLKQ